MAAAEPGIDEDELQLQTSLRHGGQSPGWRHLLTPRLLLSAGASVPRWGGM